MSYGCGGSPRIVALLTARSVVGGNSNFVVIQPVALAGPDLQI